MFHGSIICLKTSVFGAFGTAKFVLTAILSRSSAGIVASSFEAEQTVPQGGAFAPLFEECETLAAFYNCNWAFACLALCLFFIYFEILESLFLFLTT